MANRAPCIKIIIHGFMLGNLYERYLSWTKKSWVQKRKSFGNAQHTSPTATSLLHCVQRYPLFSTVQINFNYNFAHESMSPHKFVSIIGWHVVKHKKCHFH